MNWYSTNDCLPTVKINNKLHYVLVAAKYTSLSGEKRIGYATAYYSGSEWVAVEVSGMHTLFNQNVVLWAEIPEVPNEYRD